MLCRKLQSLYKNYHFFRDEEKERKMLKRKIAATAVALLCLSPLVSHAFTVGLAFPTQEDPRWYKEGFMVDKGLKDAGFKTDLYFAGETDPVLQQRQVKRLLDDNVDLLVVAAVDGSALTDALKPAIEKKIPVIAYDRLITGTEAPSYYISVDNEMIGELQGEYLAKALALGSSGQNKTIELFQGSLDDNNAKIFFKGAMKKLRLYIDRGDLVIKSGEQKADEISIPGWDNETALKRIDSLIAKQGYNPSTQKLDAVLSPNDGIAGSIIYALEKVGFTKGNMPVITGCDATQTGIENIKKGLQGMSIYKSGELVKGVVEMAQAISKGEEPDYNDDFSYDNGVKVMKSLLCDPEVIDSTNYQIAQ